MSKVKLRLSGGLAFAANIVGYITGFIFTAFIARRLSEEEFGIWALISSLIAYSLIPYNLISSWITRDAARGKKIFETSLILFVLLIPISIIIYALLGFASASVINFNPTIIFLGITILIPYTFLNLGIAVQKGYAPQKVGITSIAFEVSKVALALLLVIVLRLGLIGAIASLSLAYAFQASVLLHASKPLSQKKIDRTWILKWFKGAPINLVSILNNLLSATNVILITVILGQAITTGYWQAAVTASALVTSSRFLIRGLDARLVSGGSQTDIDKSFNFSMMFAIPMLFGFISLSKDILWVLRPAYSQAWIAACILAVSGLIRAIGNIAATILIGTDKVDQKDEVTIREYVESKIFLVSKLRMILMVLNIITVTAFLFLTKNVKSDIVKTVTVIAIINLMYSMANAGVNLKFVKKLTRLRLNFGNLKSYLVASAIMAVVIMLIRDLVGPLPVKALEAVPILLSLITIGVMTYLGILFLISEEFRKFVKEARLFINHYRLNDLF